MRYLFVRTFITGAILLLTACAGKPPQSLGVTQGRFSNCPPSENCVNSQLMGDSHYVEPLRMSGTQGEKKSQLLQVISRLPRAKLINSTDNYLLVEFKSRIMGYVDDVELLIGEKYVDIRSASRLGYADFGVNRNRVETIRQMVQP